MASKHGGIEGKVAMMTGRQAFMLVGMATGCSRSVMMSVRVRGGASEGLVVL